MIKIGSKIKDKCGVVDNDNSAKIRLTKKDIYMGILSKNRNLIDSYLAYENTKNYTDMLRVLEEEVVTVTNGIVFTPYELTNPFILVHLANNLITSGYRVYRGSDIADIAFGKSSQGYKSINSIKCNTLIVIIENSSSEYYQQLLIQLMENRLMLGLKTIFITNVHSSSFDEKLGMLDEYFFDGITIRDRFGLVDLFDVKDRRKTKKGIWK